MKYVSTRGGPGVPLDRALLEGIAPDGGLYLPQTLPQFELEDFSGADSLASIAERYLGPYFAESALGDLLDEIIEETFSFDIPLTTIPVKNGEAQMLELFHGPTAAFKDVGAGFLAACISRLRKADTGNGTESPLTILVATSGDTGGAVAAAFNGRTGVRVVVLYPDGRVSDRQARQLTCWGDNVLSLAVQGSFDDCQRLVKTAMADAELNRRHRFSSANSINIGRLLPQSIYYAEASLRHYRETGKKPGFIIPTGNLGNAFACILAREAGLPIGDIVLVTNANTLIGDYLQGATWKPRKSIQTLASAMDVGNPSNMERLQNLLGDAAALNQVVTVFAASDQDIEDEIKTAFHDHKLIICPHTATAMHAYRQLTEIERTSEDWIIVATAHAAKFESIVEPLIGTAIALPASLSDILSRPSHFTRIEPDMKSLVTQLDLNPVTSEK
jgi:threonine synthase